MDPSEVKVQIRTHHQGVVHAVPSGPVAPYVPGDGVGHPMAGSRKEV